MARQTINNGSFPDDPSAENLYVSFNKTNLNFAELYLLFLAGEYKSDGTLVYPSGRAQTVSYNLDDTVDEMTCVYGGFTWTMAFVYTNGDVTQMAADDGIGGHNWTLDITYNSDHSVDTTGVWT